ncbi:oligosaccharide flippase family protein [Sunxiuqinia sp. A32]
MLPHKILIQNFGYLSALQVFTLLVPLVTIPYLLKVLGKETYGLIVFAQTVVSYLLILINFGFNLSATKEVSIHRDDKNKLSEIVSSILIIKGAFFLLSFVILWVTLGFFPKAENVKPLFYLMMYLCLYEWIFPIWYFQGIEKMKYITIINLISRSFFLLLVFFLVKEKNDYLTVPIINGAGYSIAGFFSLWIVFSQNRLQFKWQSWKVLKYYTAESVSIFLGSIAGKIKILSNKVILGAFVGMESVAIYDIADKIKEVFVVFLQLAGQVLFPNVSKNKNPRLIRNSIRLLFVVGLAIYLILGISFQIIIPKYFESYTEVIFLFWVLGILIFIQPVSYLIGIGVLLVNNLKNEYSRTLYISTSIYLILLVGLYFYDGISIYSVSICLVLSALVSIVSNLLVCVKKKIINWIV